MHRDAQKPSRLPLWLILALTAALYAPSLRYAFVYDDQIQVINNPRITSWKNLPGFFAHHVWYHSSNFGSYWRPLFLVWLRLNNALFHAKPIGWHATTILLHLAAVSLVYFLLRNSEEDNFVAVIATAIFAVHPVHLESVAWISGLTDPLMAVSLLGALLCWLKYRNQQRRLFLIFSLLLSCLALLAKETAAIVPFLIFAQAYALARRSEEATPLKDALRACTPYVLLVAIYLATRWAVMRREAIHPFHSTREIVTNLPAFSWFYLRHLAWPWRLSVFYDFDLQHHPVLLLGSLGVVLLVVLLGVLAARKSPTLFLAWAWIVFPLAPVVAGVTAFDPHDLVHDRYLYLSAIGFGILVAVVCKHLRLASVEVFRRPAGPLFASTIVLAALIFAMQQQLPQWTNNLILFTRGVQIAPRNPMAYDHLAFEMFRDGHPNEAIKFYFRAIVLDPAITIRISAWPR